MNSGLTDTIINTLAVKGTNLFAGTANGIFLSTNNGASWTAASTGVTNTSISALGVFGSNLFAGDNGIQLSTNNGNSWLTVDSGVPSNSYVSLLSMSGANLFAGMRFSKRHPSFNEQRHELDFVGFRSDESLTSLVLPYPARISSLETDKVVMVFFFRPTTARVGLLSIQD